jgi:N-acetyl-anhydromuramyl-L-alanine amidase AmpD
MSLFTPRNRTSFIAIHCSATDADTDIGVIEIRQWHRARGWIDTGYHFVIRRDGTLEIGRPEHVIGAGVEGHNAETIHVCLVGGVDRNGKNGKPVDNFTPAQWATLESLVKRLAAKYDADVQGHRDFPGVRKACPSFDAKAWWARVNGGSAPPPSASTGSAAAPRTHTVRRGDTLSAIAQANRVTVNAIVAVNPGINPHRIAVGQVIRLP